jgi:peptide/nickel transport system permease protein
MNPGRLPLPRSLNGAFRRLFWFPLVLLLGGLAAAALVRLAPGFGVDERMLDSRLSNTSIQAIARERGDGGNIAAYYARYLGGLLRGDLGNSVSLGRPVRELLAERAGVSLRTAGMGLGLAWTAAMAVVVFLEWFRVRGSFSTLGEAAASLAAGALLCVPAALLAIACFYLGAAPAMAVSAILFPRLFRYTQNLVRQAGGAPHVLAAQALGESPWRILRLHVVTPLLPELAALAGVSVSMAAGAVIPVEALCDSPGVGQLVWQAALARDLPVIVNVTLLITALTAAANLAADLARAAREARV